MALTLRSLASAAKRRAQRAHEHVEEARHELAVANAELDHAIPSGDASRIRDAHERTRHAEQAVEDASEELEVVGELLAEDVPASGSGTAQSAASGEGMRELLKSLRSARKY